MQEHENIPPQARAVLDFWFAELTTQDWFKKNANLDAQIKERFEKVLVEAACGEHALWRQTPLGTLAQIILLDQFSRNIYRDSPLAFAHDNLALAIAQDGIAKGFDQTLAATASAASVSATAAIASDIAKKAFFYMPFMHSESRLIHKEAVRLFSIPGLEENLRFELRHKEIIDRFGRYPHRNAVLGRVSTAEELAFLKEPGSSF